MSKPERSELNSERINIKFSLTVGDSQQLVAGSFNDTIVDRK